MLNIDVHKCSLYHTITTMTTFNNDTLKTIKEVKTALLLNNCFNDSDTENVFTALYWAELLLLTLQEFKDLSQTHMKFVNLLQNKIAQASKRTFLQEKMEEGEIVEEVEEGEVVHDSDDEEEYDIFLRQRSNIKVLSDIHLVFQKGEDKESEGKSKREETYKSQKKVDMKSKKDSSGIVTTTIKKRNKTRKTERQSLHDCWHLCDKLFRIHLTPSQQRLREKLQKDVIGRNRRFNRGSFKSSCFT